VPGYLALFDLANALIPERLMVKWRNLMRDNRALTSIDPKRRREYVERVERQAANVAPAPAPAE
jgi:hypothetical protein